MHAWGFKTFYINTVTQKLCLLYGNIAVMSTGVKYTMIYTLLQLVNLIIERRFNALP